MQILADTYKLIMDTCSSNIFETGGIIGGENNIIIKFEFDEGTTLTSNQHYYPNVETLNACIEEWQNDGIQFYGIVHSHLQQERALSSGDRQYIQTIMSAMPIYISSLYFPVVLPQKEIVSFKAIKLKDGINIVNSNIKIINERVRHYEKN